MTVVQYLDSLIVNEDEAAMPKASYSFAGDDYEEAVEELSAAGFTNISTKPVYDIVVGLFASVGGVDSISVDGATSFSQGAIFKKGAEIIVTYHMDVQDGPDREDESADAEDTTDESEGISNTDDTTVEPEDTSALYSTNDSDTVKNGNTGVYAYKSKGGSYDVYWIIDFDEGYVFWFTEGNNNSICDRLEIESGDLNDVLIITYHDGDFSWSEGLHFKYKNQPDHLIMQEESGAEYDYYTTNLEDALELRDSKTIVDY